MPQETRKCVVCGLNFPRDGKRTICSPQCFEYRKKFVYESEKKEKKCRICGNKITDMSKRNLCSPECNYIAAVENRKATYAKYKSKYIEQRKELRKLKNSIKNSERSKQLRALDKKTQKTQKTKKYRKIIPEQNTKAVNQVTCFCLACENLAKKA